VEDVANALRVSRKSASRYIYEAVKLGVLKPVDGKYDFNMRIAQFYFKLDELGAEKMLEMLTGSDGIELTQKVKDEIRKHGGAMIVVGKMNDLTEAYKVLRNIPALKDLKMYYISVKK